MVGRLLVARRVLAPEAQFPFAGRRDLHAVDRCNPFAAAVCGRAFIAPDVAKAILGGGDRSPIRFRRIRPSEIEVVAVAPGFPTAYADRNRPRRGIVDMDGNGGRFPSITGGVFCHDRQRLGAFGGFVGVNLDRPPPVRAGDSLRVVTGSRIAALRAAANCRRCAFDPDVVRSFVVEALPAAHPGPAREGPFRNHRRRRRATVDNGRLGGKGAYVVLPSRGAVFVRRGADADDALDDAGRPAEVVGAQARPTRRLCGFRIGAVPICPDVFNRDWRGAGAFGEELKRVAAIAAVGVPRPAQPREGRTWRGFQHKPRLRSPRHLAGARHVCGDEPAQARPKRVARAPPLHPTGGEVFKGGTDITGFVGLTGVDRVFAGRRRTWSGEADQQRRNDGDEAREDWPLSHLRALRIETRSSPGWEQVPVLELVQWLHSWIPIRVRWIDRPG